MTEAQKAALAALAEAVDQFRRFGPGTTENWEPGEEVDDDSLAADVVNAAAALVDQMADQS